MVKFVFSHSKLRKQPFILNISKSRGAWPPWPPSDAYAHCGFPSFVLARTAFINGFAKSGYFVAVKPWLIVSSALILWLLVLIESHVLGYPRNVSLEFILKSFQAVLLLLSLSLNHFMEVLPKWDIVLMIGEFPARNHSLCLSQQTSFNNFYILYLVHYSVLYVQFATSMNWYCPSKHGLG